MRKERPKNQNTIFDNNSCYRKRRNMKETYVVAHFSKVGDNMS